MNIRKTLIALLILTMIMATSACGSTVPETTPGNNPDYKVAMVTDSGDITDQSFNQITYTAMAEYCEENHIDYTYKKPDGDTDYARIAMVDVAVAEGYNIIILPGYTFAATLVEVTYKYPDIKFIALDMTARATPTVLFTVRKSPVIWQDIRQYASATENSVISAASPFLPLCASDTAISRESTLRRKTSA